MIIPILVGIVTCTNQDKQNQGKEHDSEKGKASYRYNPKEYEGIAPEYGYLQEKEQLEAAIESKDLKTIRKHGWKLWAGIVQPSKRSDWPLWFTWPNTYDAFIQPISSHVGVGASGKSHRQKLTRSLIAQNKQHIPKAILDTLPVDMANTPYYPIPDSVKRAYGKYIKGNDIMIGPHFMSNGDIMIPTESISLDGVEWIVNNKLNDTNQLSMLYNEKKSGSGGNIDSPETYVVTKHMFWPVKANMPNLVPVWNPEQFPLDYPRYAGYETWKDFVVIDPSGNSEVGGEVTASYLFGVFTDEQMHQHWGPIEASALVHDIDEFYHYQVSQTMWNELDSADQASIMAACYWATGKPFEVGDYLVTIAMHINTKEIETWALQSVWWSNKVTQYSSDKPDLPEAEGPWENYDLVTEYGLVGPDGQLPIAFNPYIEPVIHPLATNCRNCHQRAGFPAGKNAGEASYQNPDCKDLLAPLTPESECLQDYLLTDMQWIIPDHAK